eukprot:4252005-Pyramimonas_sp.AAC.1
MKTLARLRSSATSAAQSDTLLFIAEQRARARTRAATAEAPAPPTASTSRAMAVTEARQAKEEAHGKGAGGKGGDVPVSEIQGPRCGQQPQKERRA